MYGLIFYLKNKKNLINLLTLLVIILALPLGLGAIRQQQVLTSHAQETKIIFPTKEQSGSVTPEGESCVKTVNNKLVTSCKDMIVRIYVGDYNRVFPNASRLTQSFDVVKKAYAQNCNEGGPECWDGQMYWVRRDIDTNELCGDPVGPSGTCGDTPPPPSLNEGEACGEYDQDCGNGGRQRCYKRISGGSCVLSVCEDCQGETQPVVCPTDNIDESHGWSFQTCGNCHEELWTCGGSIKGKNNDGGNCSDPTYNSACPSGGGQQEDFCKSGDTKIDDINKNGPYLVDFTIIGDDFQPWKEGKTCGYKYYKWSAPRIETGSGVGYDSGPYCVKTNDYNFGAWVDQEGPNGCKAEARKQQGLPPAGESGVAIGTGGCCKEKADCKASNLYKGQSTAGWECTDNNINCQGGLACMAPGKTDTGTDGCCETDADCKTGNGTSKAGDSCVATDAGKACKSGKICQSAVNSDCHAYFQEGTDAPWKTSLDNVKAGDSVKVGALRKGTSNPKDYTPVTGTTLKVTGPGVSKELEQYGYFTTGGAGNYTLTVTGGACGTSGQTATMKVVAASPAPSPSPGLSPSPTTPRIVAYRLSETSGVFNTGWTNLTSSQDFANGVDATMNFSATPGEKFVFVQFKDANGRESGAPYMQAKIEFGLIPTLKTVNCPYSIGTGTGNGILNISITGTNFGTAQGTVTPSLNGSNVTATVDTWTDTAITAHIDNPKTDTTTGTDYKVTVTKANGQSNSDKCGVNVSALSLGVQSICDPVNYKDVSGVKFFVYDMQTIGTTKEKSEETITVSKEGLVKDVKTKLQKSKEYVICVRPPMGLLACSEKFAFSPGTVVTKIKTNVGDLNKDGCKNSVDASLLKQQFGAGAAKSADINGDGAVNSFEWACEMKDFNKCDATPPF